jgi:phage shock protein E
MKKLTISFIFLIILAGLISCSNSDKTVISQINAKQAMEMLENDETIILIDVRTFEEYKSGHIEGSILIPHDIIESEIEKAVPNKETSIIIYCRTGNRTKTAGRILKGLGYSNIFDMGGIVEWPYGLIK